MSEQLTFSYFQLYSARSFSGSLIDDISKLADELSGLNPGAKVAAALTDTFSLANFDTLKRFMHQKGLVAIAGMEVGLAWDETRPLPYSLLLFAENADGYASLCRLASNALIRAGQNPLAAYLTLPELSSFNTGLVAVSPYYGGPVAASLRLGKTSEAKQRALFLKEMFGPDNFYLGVSPISSELPPGAVGPDSPEIKLNATLVKISRDTKIGLLGTGEARYLAKEQEAEYRALHGRAARYLTAQLTPTLLLKAQGDWLYALAPARPNAPLELRSSTDLQAYYNNSDWPGALANNRLIGERLTGWVRNHKPDYTAELRHTVTEALAAKATELPGEAQARLEQEFELAASYGLEEVLLVATDILHRVKQQPLFFRWLGNSLLAWLLGLTPVKPELSDKDDPFENYGSSRWNSLRVLVGLDGREKLLEALNLGQHFTDWNAAPLALPESEPGAPPVMHPRYTLFSRAGSIVSYLPLQPAEAETLHLSVTPGQVLPDGLVCLEVTESRSLAWAELSLHMLNHKEGSLKYKLDELPVQPATGEHEYLMKRLEYLRQHHSPACYGAALSLADLRQRAPVADAMRQENISLLPPRFGKSSYLNALEGEQSVRAGLGLVLGKKDANTLLSSTRATLEELAGACDFTPDTWEKLAWSGALDDYGPREQLAAGALALTEYGMAYREQKSAQKLKSSDDSSLFGGQLSLFDLPGEDTSLRELSLELPEYEKLDRYELLQKQYEVLGCHTAEHPLWENVTAAGVEQITLGQALASEGNTSLVVMGLVAGLRRIPVTAGVQNGQELTILKLEDWSGQAELMVPPAIKPAAVILEKGAVISALARRVVPESSGGRSLLVAEAVGGLDFSGLTAQVTDQSQIEEILLEDTGLPPQASDEWANGLFAEYGAQVVATETKSIPASQQSKPGGKSSKKAPEPSRTRKIHINLPHTDSHETDTELMMRLRKLLEKYPGEDELYIYLPKEGGGYRRFRPTTLSVSYSPEMAAEVQNLAGLDSIRVEE